jgi:ribosomal peptide maturation radical SAM protein 1
MAEGISSLSDSIDYIFSGESELTFSKFLQGYSKGQLPSKQIIMGESLEDLDSLPLYNFDAFLNQVDVFLGHKAPKGISISYETSKGCWWGQKKKCSFCTLTNKRFRQKTPLKVLKDLEQLNKRYPNRRIFVTDNIMPFSFHKELIPELSQKGYPGIHYMIKANLKLKEIINLKAAGIDVVTPGIEALSTSLLKLANKGTTARLNLSFLRNARSVGLYLNWQLLWGFPNDKVIHYEETLNLIPLIRHMQPSEGLTHIIFQRFSPYLKNPSRYRISDFQPWAIYSMIYPEKANIDKLAFFFTANYPSESHTHPELIQELYKEWQSWRKMWEKSILVIIPFMDYYIIYDKRGIDGNSNKHILNEQQAREVMTTCIYKETENKKWAVEQKLGVVVDSWYVPLVTASPDLLLKFEEKSGG